MTVTVNFDFIQSYVNFADRFEVPPQMHESIALSLIAGVVNGNVYFNWGSEVPLDFWLMNVSGSGSGRSTAVKVHQVLLQHAGLLDLDQKVGWGSPQGVIQYFAEHPTGLPVYSEASEFLGHLTEPRFRTLKPWLVDLYDNTNLPRGLNAYRVNPNKNPRSRHSGPKVGSDTTDKRRGRRLGRRLDKLDRELAERRAVVGATGEPVVERAISAVPMSEGSCRKIKRCRLCLAPAQYSLAFVISTLGIKPRLQKCSPVILLCDLCIHKLSRALALASPELKDALETSYTAINSPSVDARSTGEKR
jgi:hypothetical protein